MENGTTGELSKALEATDRSLRRVMRAIKDADPPENEQLDKELRVARRQIRANDPLLQREDPSGKSDAD